MDPPEPFRATCPKPEAQSAKLRYLIQKTSTGPESSDFPPLKRGAACTAQITEPDKPPGSVDCVESSPPRCVPSHTSGIGLTHSDPTDRLGNSARQLGWNRSRDDGKALPCSGEEGVKGVMPQEQVVALRNVPPNQQEAGKRSAQRDPDPMQLVGLDEACGPP
ncbi:hypothetical protein AAFF_G00130780 [Aldrovandia affinis]|uniref:Uncharacterized protein n=1 Tax=Aldrovandia affinis TaxID=143900 RepID=A0AAD7RQU6_9TELE|nr:hypothetical protein AAFF_G00130780 [Aldrovandia affinis]